MLILIIKAIEDKIVNIILFPFIKLWTINIKSGIKFITGIGITDKANKTNSVNSNGSANSVLIFPLIVSSDRTKSKMFDGYIASTKLLTLSTKYLK